MPATAILLGLVVGIADGDTLTLLTPEQEQIKVRLAEIDAPEKSQPFGQRSKQSLSDLCYQKQAQLQVVDIDRYGRSVARVTCAGSNANAAQVSAGMAWVYDKYAKGTALYPAQDEAKGGPSRPLERPSACASLGVPQAEEGPVGTALRSAAPACRNTHGQPVRPIADPCLAG